MLNILGHDLMSVRICKNMPFLEKYTLKNRARTKNFLFYKSNNFNNYNLLYQGKVYRYQTMDPSIHFSKNSCSSTVPHKIYATVIPIPIYLQFFIIFRDFCRHLHSKETLLENDLDRLHKSWTGLCAGFSFDCLTDSSEKLNIWIPDLSLIPQAEFIAVKPNSLFDHLCGETRDANGKLKMSAINPVTSRELPVYVSEDPEYPFGRDTYLGVPAVFETDRRFAGKVGLKLGASDGFCSPVAKKLDLQFYQVGSQHSDWLITQDYDASVPVPLVQCPDCGFQSVPEQELPITLPPLPEDLQKRDFDVFLETNDWTKTVCPK